MNDSEILTIIAKYNPWWSGNKIPSSQLLSFKRRFFYVLVKQYPKDNKIMSILGPRRVGKTVLLHQLIEYLIENNVKPENILYVSLDNTELRRGQVSINDILESYYRLVLKKTFEDRETKTYVFLDEIQAIEDWHKILKNVWDLKYSIKFFVSGSSSMALSKGAMESLLGRMTPFVVLPFKFGEVLNYEKTFPIETLEVSNLRKAFVNSIVKDNPKILFDAFSGVLGRVVPLKEKILILLNRYFIVGGYPEFLGSNDYLQINQTIQEKLKFTFYRDIIQFYKLRNANVLDDLFSMLASSSGSKINISKTAHDLGIQRPTLKAYLEHFKDIFLVSETEFYSRSRRVRSLKNKKICVCDTGVRNSSLGMLDETVLENPKEIGSIAECFAFDCLKRLKFNLEPGPNPKVFHWSNKKEVDFIFELKGHPIPIEVKYSNSILQEEMIGIKEFMKQFKINFGIILSKDVFELRENILIIPIWLFALIV